MATDTSFKAFKDSISSALVDTTRTAGQISNEDLAFHRSSNPSIVPLLEQQNTRLLQLTRRLTKNATLGTEVTAPQVSGVESIEDNWKTIVDVIDNLLEKADACLDEFTGVVRKLSPGQEEHMMKASFAGGKQRLGKAYQTQDIKKPQLLFEHVPKNDEKTPFKPILRSKPHALTSLDESLVIVPSSDGSQQYKHPYETEIRISQFPAAVSVRADPVPYLSFEATSATFVDTPEAVFAMLQDLKTAKEIAVDLEHHDEHSYIGIVSLMQISTRDKDWIVDTLKPWRHELQMLNEVFTDPQILKVFHGAYMDMVWLQRDFGLYVVGLFDTYHASRSLGYPKHSLAYLLKRFANFDAAKQYQMADWRIRPLPAEMQRYARSDTHFLLYVFDNMRNELIEKSDPSQSEGDLINTVMNNSKEEALQRYERPLYDAQRGLGSMGWYNLLYRTPALFNREQFAVFKATHRWRDDVARQEDESIHSIMPKHVLYNIARETPIDMPSLIGCSHPMSKTFREKKGDLLGIIRQAKIVGATGPEMKDFMQIDQPPYIERTVIAAVNNQPASDPVGTGKESPKRTRPNQAASLFWGSIVPNPSLVERRRLQSDEDSLHLMLPLPPLTTEVFATSRPTGRPSNQPSQTGLRVQAGGRSDKVEKPREDILIVKQGRSQKRHFDEMREIGKDSGYEGNGEMKIPSLGRDLGSVDQNEKQRSKILKRAKKEARKLEKEQAKARRMMPEVEAFDYGNAPSVLHSQRDGVVHDGPGSRPENPYQKSMNAPKGLRKTKTEIQGKSFTFQN